MLERAEHTEGCNWTWLIGFFCCEGGSGTSFKDPLEFPGCLLKSTVPVINHTSVKVIDFSCFRWIFILYAPFIFISKSALRRLLAESISKEVMWSFQLGSLKIQKGPYALTRRTLVKMKVSSIPCIVATLSSQTRVSICKNPLKFILKYVWNRLWPLQSFCEEVKLFLSVPVM